MTKEIASLFLGLVFLTSLAPPARAAVSAEQAARLGAELTPLGADKAANADGTIPAWTGGVTRPPAGYAPGDHHPDPFAGDDILFTITAENADEYADRLTAAHKAFFARFPDYKMNVYPTRRSAAFPPHVYEATKKNATSARVVAGGDSVEGAIIGVPFPIPQSGAEAIWNHLLRYKAETVRRHVVEAVVHPNGRRELVYFQDETINAYSRKNATPEGLDNVIGYFMQRFTSPARFAGTILLIHETLNQAKEPRHSWLYSPGQRRVRRAPFIGYDSASPSTDGLRLIDQFDMFNGATDRYDWKLIGKKEMYVPYNAYRLHADDLTYDRILTPNFINPALARYELHRVWIVEATVKDGHRHLFPRRTFYLDEDSWQALVVDQYDSEGRLWRASEGHPINYYDVPNLWTTLEVHADLPSGRYVVLGMNNQEPMYEFNVPLELSDFTPASLRRLGTR